MTNLNLTDFKWQHRPLWELTAKKDRRKLANETYVQRTGDNVAIFRKDQRIILIGLRTVVIPHLKRCPDPILFRLNKVLRDNGITGYAINGGRYREATVIWNDGTRHSERFESVTFELQGDRWVMTIEPPVAA
jgi:hypothetical protein